MGYPMSWRRILSRHGVDGGYDGTSGVGDGVGAPCWQYMEPERFRDRPRDPVRAEWKNYLAGDLRRLESDQRDDRHLATYAARAGITPEQARTVLDALFQED